MAARSRVDQAPALCRRFNGTQVEGFGQRSASLVKLAEVISAQGGRDRGNAIYYNVLRTLMCFGAGDPLLLLRARGRQDPFL